MDKLRPKDWLLVAGSVAFIAIGFMVGVPLIADYINSLHMQSLLTESMNATATVQAMLNHLGTAIHQGGQEATQASGEILKYAQTQAAFKGTQIPPFTP